MMKLSEEEIQKLLENNELPSANDDADIQAYRLLFDALKEATKVPLSVDFSLKVVEKIAVTKKPFAVLDYVAMGTIFIFIVLAVAIGIVVGSGIRKISSLNLPPVLMYLLWPTIILIVFLLIDNRNVKKRVFGST